MIALVLIHLIDRSKFCQDLHLSGCIATIFKLVANKMRLNIKGLEVIVEAEKSEEIGTIAKANIVVNVKTDEKKEKVERALKTTLDTCPVGLLFKRANVESKVTLNVEA